jgi:hypothetical protein
MSWFSEALGGVTDFVGNILSGGAGARRDALNALEGRAQAAYRDLGDEYRDLFRPIVTQYTRDRAANMEMYRTEMGRALSDFSRYFEQARTEYGAGMDRALGEMRVGRESSIEATRQETRRQQAAQTASNAFSGLGQTTFGQQRVQNIGSQGALREGMIREQYAGQLSALEVQRAQGMSTLSAQMGQGMSGLQQSLAGNLSNMYQAYSGQIANMQTVGLGQQFNIYQQGLNVGYNFAGQSANLAGAAFAPFSSIVGAAAGSLVGAGINNLFSPGMSTPNTYSGLYTNQAGMDVNGGYNRFGGAVGGR